MQELNRILPSKKLFPWNRSVWLSILIDRECYIYIYIPLANTFVPEWLRHEKIVEEWNANAFYLQMMKGACRTTKEPRTSFITFSCQTWMCFSSWCLMDVSDFSEITELWFIWSLWYKIILWCELSYRVLKEKSHWIVFVWRLQKIGTVLMHSVEIYVWGLAEQT